MNIEILKRRVLGHVPMKGDSSSGGGGGGDSDSNYSNEGRNRPAPSSYDSDSSPDYSSLEGIGITSTAQPSAPPSNAEIASSWSPADFSSSAPGSDPAADADLAAGLNPDLDPTSPQKITREDLARVMDKPTGPNWTYDFENPGWREKLYDMTNPTGDNTISRFLRDLGVRGAGMSFEQQRENETPEETAARYEAWNKTASFLADLMTPAPVELALSAVRGIESGDVGGVIGGLVGRASGVPMGQSLGTLAGRSVQNNTPPSLDAISRIVSSYAGGRIGSQIGSNFGRPGSVIGGMLGANIGGNWGFNGSSAVSTPKAENSVGGVASGKGGDGADDSGFNTWAGKDGKSVISKAVGGL